MAAMRTQYDSYNRSWPKVFVGEYAANGGAPDLQAAIAEAAFLLGFEHNGDVVQASSFAPLFNRLEASQWHYDLINFNSSASFALPSYYLQRMFRRARGDYTVASAAQGSDLTMAVATVNASAGLLHVKLVNYDAAPHTVSCALSGFAGLGSSADWEILTSSDGAAAQNTLDGPTHVATASMPAVSLLPNASFTVQLPAWSASVITVPFNNNNHDDF